MSVNLDPELTELFAADPELTELAGLLATATAPRVQPNPAFQRGLRDRLVREGWRRQTSPAQPWFRRLFFTSTSLNWSAGIAGILLIVFGLLIFNTRQGFSPVEVSSPLADAHQVAVVKPIQLSFTQPMNKPATEAAISLKPATRVSYHWTSPSKVEITPQAGSLTPGTKYQVTVAPTARTAAGTVLPKPSQLHFVTAEPAPPAAPPASDDGLSPTLAGIHSLGSTGGARSAWSSDGRHLYVIDPAGQLLAYSAAGGAAQVIASSGVSQVAAGPEGIAYVQGNDLVYGNQALQGVSPQAIGWQNSSPIYLSGQDVLSQGQSRLHLSSAASAASFSPSGSRLAYLTSEGLHLADLSNGSDRLLDGVTQLGAWSPDSSNYAYVHNHQLFLAGDKNSTRIADTGETDSLSWRGNQLLLAGENGLYLLPSSGGNPTLISSAAGSDPLWSPTANIFSYKEENSIWIAQISHSSNSRRSQEEAVEGFMKARSSGDAMAAESFLKGDQSNLDQLPLLYKDPQNLLRYQTVLDQPEHMTLRLFISQGADQKSVDETITLHPDEQGRWWIWNLNDAPARNLSSGPELASFKIDGSQIEIGFSTDLDPKTISAVSVDGMSSIASYQAGSRTVILALTQPPKAKEKYQLEISSGLQDINHNSATPDSLEFVGPDTSTPAAPLPPTVTPSPTPQPTPSSVVTVTPTPTPNPSAPVIIWPGR